MKLRDLKGGPVEEAGLGLGWSKLTNSYSGLSGNDLGSLKKRPEAELG